MPVTKAGVTYSLDYGGKTRGGLGMSVDQMIKDQCAMYGKERIDYLFELGVVFSALKNRFIEEFDEDLAEIANDLLDGTLEVTKKDAIIEQTKPDLTDLIKKYEKANCDYVGMQCYKEFLSDLRSLSIIEHNQKVELKVPEEVSDDTVNYPTTIQQAESKRSITLKLK